MSESNINNLDNLKFDEREPYEKWFSDYFEKEVKQELIDVNKNLENDKWKIINKKKWYELSLLFLIVSIILLAIVYYFLMPKISEVILSNKNTLNWLWFVSIFIIINSIYLLSNTSLSIVRKIEAYKSKWKYRVNEYIKQYSKSLMIKIVWFFWKVVQYIQYGELIKSKTIIESWIFGLSWWERYLFQDWIDIIYNDTKLLINEIKIQWIVQDKNNKYVDIFNWFFLLIDIKKSFRWRTYIFSDKWVFGNLIQNLNKMWNIISFNCKKIKLEDPLFEEDFEIYWSDEVESRYLITPAFMQRLIQLKRKIWNNKFQCSFFDNKLFIAIPTDKPFLESFSSWDLITIDDIHTLLSDMYYMVSIVDTLKLDQKIGM